MGYFDFKTLNLVKKVNSCALKHCSFFLRLLLSFSNLLLPIFAYFDAFQPFQTLLRKALPSTIGAIFRYEKAVTTIRHSGFNSIRKHFQILVSFEP